ncbi:threonine dehydratase [Granulicella tundricola]|uniref:Pyridoxal-5'-phosphate-dependent protein beta subunit n=1 Tax=Granulicella tundricola (strain ATCC BAA-1859 / DSM 23138 / MP5ACTX9) TaxID=1198114 RepID=E8X0E9_GRATM|nr:threonine dehydratase [Granulicella tundricola]ADW67813.1 Pyridoxal-5'-phosphate-dependent protein beta subunit [Granulicella tundricola MP5ACTX9]
MSWSLPTLGELESAAELIYRHMPATPQYRWPLLDAVAGTEVWVKHENHTPVGAFKIRGGIVYMDMLLRTRPDIRGVVGATRGNHGQSMGFAARMTGTSATVVVPRGNSPEKNAAMRALGVAVIEAGEDFQEACEYADALAQDRGLHRLPSLATELVCGVGTYALEFLRTAPVLDTVYVPIGMGSGICGMMAARDALNLPTKIVGVVSTGAPAYKLSFEAGRKIEHDVTTLLADGLACRSPNEDCLAAMLAGVDRVIAVDEDEVAAAMRSLFIATHNVAEGAGAASFAALMQEKDAMQGKRIGVVLCGGNVDADIFAKVLAG